MSIAASENKRESYYQEMFKEVYPQISNAKLSKGPKFDRHNIPDAWINDNGEEIPVEVKLGDFDKNALAQLQRYITAFDCKHGIAVARTLTVELPGNIKFVSFDELEEAQKRCE